jgi:predicted dehydrogenase
MPAITEPGRHGIAIIGAGAIVTSAHLPAYRSMGARVRGIYDIDSTRAERAAATFGIPETYPDLDALLNDHEVDIVDIAVPPQVQEQLVPKLITAGKHLLCQKPLAMTAMTAQTLVGLASAASVRMGVNVNMRWSPAIRAIKQLMEKEVFGPVTSVLMNVNFWDDWTTWPWLRNERELLIRYDAIHLIDSLRFLFGEAQSIYATASRLPNSPVKGETDVSLVFRYPEFTTFIHDSADNWAGDTCAEFRIEGTDATTKGILGVWYDYPVGRDDRIDLQRNCQRGDWITFHPPGRWVPDAWAWTMAEMFDAIDSGRDPIHNGQDHVQTLKYVEAAYESIQHNRVVTL